MALAASVDAYPGARAIPKWVSTALRMLGAFVGSMLARIAALGIRRPLDHRWAAGILGRMLAWRVSSVRSSGYPSERRWLGVTNPLSQRAREVALKRPEESAGDGWAKKIEIAKKARSEAIKARKGKPATFADRVVVSSNRK